MNALNGGAGGGGGKGGGVGVLAADGEQEGSIAVCDNVPMAEGMALDLAGRCRGPKQGL